jgi:hypothetical protein
MTDHASRLSAQQAAALSPEQRPWVFFHSCHASPEAPMMSDIARVCAKPGSRAAAAAGAGRLALGRAPGGLPRRREHVEIDTARPMLRPPLRLDGGGGGAAIETARTAR